MKVLFIASAYPRTEGDIITPWLVEMVHRLQQRGIVVEVLAPAYRGWGDQITDGVRVHRFRYAPARWETLTHDQTAPDRLRDRPIFFGLLPGYLIAGSLAAARLVRRRRFDLVHAFWPLPHGVLGLVAKAAAKIPLVSTFFGVELTWVKNQLPLLRPALQLILRHSDAVTVISSYTAAEVRHVAPSVQPTIIPFGATVAPPTTPRRKLTEASPPYELLFVGRLVARKGVHVLLEATAQLPRAVPLVVHIVGDGPDRGSLQALAAELSITDRVVFHGFVTTEELSRRFAECFAFVLPAVVDAKGDTEGLGVVLLEALSYAKPVIATAAGGIVDIVRHEETGWLVPPGDVEALAEAICACVSNPAKATAMGEAGREHVEREFSWDAILNRLEQVYSSVV